jgi:hypothetical protein
MQDAPALRIAIDLMQVPSRVRLYQDEPLPPGMDFLLRVAAKADGAAEDAEVLLSRPAAFLHEAATFFVEQILFAPQADHYRVLGADSATSTSDLRRNMALLLRWLHPDVAADHDRSVFAARVATAWDAVKTADRREAYDQVLADQAHHHNQNQSQIMRQQTSAGHAASGTRSRRHIRRGPAWQRRPGGLLRRLARLLSPRVT